MKRNTRQLNDNVSSPKMIGQKSRRPASKKRVSKDLKESEEEEEDAKDLKKLKSSAVEPESSSPPPAPLSRSNKKTKKEKGASDQTAPEFGESWREGLSAEFEKPYFKQLMSFVSEERKHHNVYPAAEDVFTWTQMCDIRDVKVVILGQDPYHGPNQAHGLCFSVKRPEPPPPSLKNMYKELVSDIEGFQPPGHGDLTEWAKQGVLLLNAVLTVRAHQANSHKDKGWETFTDAVVQWLSNNMEGLVFMLWGAYAQKKGAAINRKRHHVLQAVHPSPLSANKGFFGCKHFSKANELLKQSGKSAVNWKAL
ncbi:uracil-DNA glycosylase-like [Tautogolabrus adspersus]